MDKAIPGRTRMERFCHCCLPRQHQFNPAGKTWTKFKYEVDKAHEHKILLCNRASQEQGRSCNTLPHRGMVGDFFTKPLQGSIFIKMRNYIMGSEEPGYQALPRSVLRDHDTTTTRKQKFIGTRKRDSEAAKTSHEHMNKDSDGSTRDVSTKNMQGTSTQMKRDDEESIGDDNTKEKQRGSMSSVVEPRSYRDVLMNGEEQQTMT